MSEKEPTRREPDRPSDEERPRRTIASDELLQGSEEVHIRHGDVVYRLRVTRSGKLILHK